MALKEKMEKNQFVKPAFIIGVALLVGLWIHGVELQGRDVRDTITVTGSTKTRVTADLAKWNASFSARAGLGDVSSVLAQVIGYKDQIKKFAVSEGLKDDAVTFLPVQTDPVYSQNQYGASSDVIGYNVRQEVRIESTEIEKIEKLATDVKRLVDQGIVPEYQRTEYYYTKLADLRPRLFAEATQDAKTRAEAIASGTGVGVGSLRSAKTGVIQILAPDSTDVADYGAYDLTTKEKEITATVTVSFALK